MASLILLIVLAMKIQSLNNDLQEVFALIRGDVPIKEKDFQNRCETNIQIDVFLRMMQLNNDLTVLPT